MLEENTQKFNERELENSYPVYNGYLYVVDGKVFRSPDTMTVAEIKQRYDASSVTNCDLKGRDLFGEMV